MPKKKRTRITISRKNDEFEQFVTATLTAIKRQGDYVMATVDEMNAKLDAIPPVLDAIEADTKSLQDQIKALSDQVAAGQPVTQAQLDAMDAKAQSILDRTQGIDASVP